MAQIGYQYIHYNKTVFLKQIHFSRFQSYLQLTSPMSTSNIKDKPKSLNEKRELYEKIQKEKYNLARAEDKIAEIDHKIGKVVESNVRNSARLMRHRARLQELLKSKNNPEILLAFSGIMNEYVQNFMISHNFQMNVDLTNVNPDNMSYEQLLELGEKIGKVSKGLSKEQIERLDHIKMRKKDESCPICCSEFEFNQLAISLRCKHAYHEQCITEWLKDQNRCPICKQYVLKQKQEKQG